MFQIIRILSVFILFFVTSCGGVFQKAKTAEELLYMSEDDEKSDKIEAKIKEKELKTAQNAPESDKNAQKLAKNEENEVKNDKNAQNLDKNAKKYIKIAKNAPENEEKTVKYVLGSEDVPLIDNFEEISDENTSFDTISGTIVISAYKTRLNSGDVKDFYKKTLPQMGWELVTSGDDNVLYQRDNNKLEISLRKEGYGAYVKFFISSS